MKTDFERSAQTFGTMYEVVCHWAEKTPYGPALVDEVRPPLSYRALRNAIDAMGTDLNRLGIGRDDRVAIVCPGGRDTALTILGIWSYATPLPINPEATLAEIVMQLREMRANVVAVASNMDTPARSAADILGLPILELSVEQHGTVAVTCSNGEILSLSNRFGPAQSEDIIAVLATSGTTSTSKIVPIRHRQLVCRNIYAARALELGPRDRCLNMLRLYHAGGLDQGLSASLVSGGSIGILADFSPTGFFDALESLQPTWCTGAYTFYHAIGQNLVEYQHRIPREPHPLRFLRSGTGPLNPEIADTLEKAFDVPLLETYGASETGAVTSEPLPPGRRKRESVGPLLHDNVAILDPAGKAIAQGEEGEIAVRGPTVFDGYEKHAAAAGDPFVNGWCRTGDLGFLDNDNYLFVTGRIKEMINRGGQKISPDEVDNALLQHPDVVAAAVFPVPHPTLGEEVAAAVVLMPDVPLDEATLSSFLREHLAAYKVPRQFVVVEEIPIGATGKVQRQKIAALFHAAGTSGTAADVDENRPATKLERQLQSIWASVLGQPKVGLNDDFFALGGDSLQAVTLFLRIEEAIGRRLPRSVLFEASTIADMATHIGEPSSSPCLVPIQPAGDRPIFFCVHDVNGQVLNFRAFAKHLGKDRPFYGIQLVGLNGEETPLARVDDMAARYIAEIRSLQPIGPYYLGGYSMGGLVAYEMAQQLLEEGEVVAMLALLDTFPGRKRLLRMLLDWFEEKENQFIDGSLSSAGGYLARGLRNIAQNSRTIAWRYLFGVAWRFCETCKITIPKRLCRPLAANLLAIRSYRLQPYKGDAVLFEAEPYRHDHKEMRELWRNLIVGDFRVRPISGMHHQILEEPYVVDLARKLAKLLCEKQT